MAQSAVQEPLIEARGLGVSYGGVAALRDVDFVIRPGEIVTVVGPNGSGKTSFLRALIGAIKPSAGDIRRSPGLRLGYTPQKLAVDRSMPITVDRFLALAGDAMAAERRATLERVGADGLGGRQLTELSGGQFQRVLLAHALLRRPDLLVLDEPTSGLDQPGEAAFYQLIDAVRRETGCAVLLVSHDLHVVMGASDRVICLNGHVCCQGAPLQVAARPEYRRLFGIAAEGALALYRHDHDHTHEDGSACAHDHPPPEPAPLSDDAR